MRLKTLCWNLHTATSESPAWRIIEELNPDIAPLQKVHSIPLSLKQSYTAYFRKASKTYEKQKFGSAILSKFPLNTDLEFVSDYAGANREMTSKKLGDSVEGFPLRSNRRGWWALVTPIKPNKNPGSQ